MTRKNMRKKKLGVRLTTVVPLIIFVLIPGCKKADPIGPSGMLTIPVRLVAVKTQLISIPIIASGRLFPKAMVKLSFKVGGIIGALHAEEGDTVKKGQLLASLKLSEISSRFNQAKEGWLKAKRDLDRVRNLYKDRAATLEQQQNAKTAFDLAESTLKIAKFNLDNSYIHAPTKGKILKRFYEENEMAARGSPIFLFGSTQKHWVVKTGVSEKDIVRLTIGDNSYVTFDAYGENRTFSASVTEIAQAIDIKSGTYEVELTLNPRQYDENQKLIAGFVGRLRIEPSDKKPYRVVPIDTIVEAQGDEGTVFTVKADRAVKVDIKIAHILPQSIIVASGLENIDWVVNSGAAYLRDGATVKVKR